MKVSKYYEHGWLQNYLSTASFVKNTHVLAEIYFLFLKKRTRPNLKIF